MRLFSDARLLFMRGRNHWRLDHDDHRRRSNHDNWMHRNSACGSLGDDRSDGRMGSDGGWSLNDGWRGTRLRKDSAWRRMCVRRRWSGNYHWRHVLCGSQLGGGHDNRRPGRSMDVARAFLFFLFLGQNSFQHVTGLGDMREVNLGSDDLRSVCACGAGVTGRPGRPLKMCANLVRLI
jgi:hypothetical protein